MYAMMPFIQLYKAGVRKTVWLFYNENNKTKLFNAIIFFAVTMSKVFVKSLNNTNIRLTCDWEVKQNENMHKN